MGDNALTSENVSPPDNFRAYSPQTAGDSRRQPDTPASNSRSPSRATTSRPTPQTCAIRGEIASQLNPRSAKRSVSLGWTVSRS